MMTNKEFFVNAMIEEGLQSFSGQYEKEIVELRALVEVMKEKGRSAKKIDEAQKQISQFEKTKENILSDRIKKEIKEFAEKEVSILTGDEIDKVVENYKFNQKVSAINEAVANKFLEILDKCFDEKESQ